MARVMEHHGAALNFEAMEKDKAHPHWQAVINSFRMLRKMKAEAHDERAIIEQWRDKVTYSVTALTSIVVILLKKQGRQIRDEKDLKQLRGIIKNAINRRKKGLFGAVENDAEFLKNTMAGALH